MKKEIVLLVLSMLCIVVLAHAEDSVVWQEKLINDGQYYKSYAYQNCTVYVPKGRERLIIETVDDTPELTKIQEIKIYEGDQRMEVRHWKIYKFAAGTKKVPCQNGYDIFAIKYRKAAENLPPNVRDMFFGNYGM